MMKDVTAKLEDRIVIAIDGPAASGKTTIGKALAHHFKLRFINTGVMYRAVAWALKQGLKLEEIKLEVDDQSRVSVNGQMLGEELYQRELDRLASKCARNPKIRAKLIGLQRELARPGNVVMEGRDIGTVVLPDADIKIYVDAPVKERARRRALQRPDASFEEILRELLERDRRDRGFGRLSPAPEALRLKTGSKTLEESIAEAISLVEESLKVRASCPRHVERR